MSFCEGFCRQPIALIGHDGLEQGRDRSDPVSLPNNNSGNDVADNKQNRKKINNPVDILSLSGDKFQNGVGYKPKSYSFGDTNRKRHDNYSQKGRDCFC